MRSIVFLMIGASLAYGQSATSKSKNVPAVSISPVAAYNQLYQATAQITSSPGSGYQPPKVDDWPAVTAAQRNWTSAMAANGTTLSPTLKAQLVANATHCNNAIADVESAWRIHLIQKSSSAQDRAKILFAEGREEFAECTVIRPDGATMPPSPFSTPSNPNSATTSETPAPSARSDAAEPTPSSVPPPSTHSDVAEPSPSTAPAPTTRSDTAEPTPPTVSAPSNPSVEPSAPAPPPPNAEPTSTNSAHPTNTDDEVTAHAQPAGK
jgi:hypothetical protein